jgi:predicted dehydrogenase
MSIGVAIIGGGIFVREEHLVSTILICIVMIQNKLLTPLEPAVQAASSYLTLKAIYSRSIKSAKALEAKVDLYSDDSGSGNTYHDLLLRDDIQAVILALPINNQPEYIEAALAAGKHVLSEKPIARDITHAEKLIQYYKSDKVKGGATWGVAENFRFLDSFLFGRKEVEKLGRILGFRTKMFGNVQPGGKYFGTLKP